jgi:hypothetical protein
VRAWARTLDKALGPLIEIPAALLVVAEVVVLLAGMLTSAVIRMCSARR